MGIDTEPCSSSSAAAAEARNVRSLIVDAEIVALSADGALLPFQTLASRSRKDVSLADVKVRVGIFAFDLMLLDGAPLPTPTADAVANMRVIERVFDAAERTATDR